MKKIRHWLLGVSLMASVANAADPAKYKLVNLVAWEGLDQRQAKLLSSFLPAQSAGVGALMEADAWIPSFQTPYLFKSWADRNDGQASAFLAITHALRGLTIYFKDGTSAAGLDLIRGVREVKGDRIIVQFDEKKFEAWREAGGDYMFREADGKVKKGSFVFKNHGDAFASLHSGYDIMGCSARNDVPRIQINYRFKDQEADIDIDGYRPWVGIFPNPRHLTYENSDVRYWFESYTKRFGNPGFGVAEAAKPKR